MSIEMFHSIGTGVPTTHPGIAVGMLDFLGCTNGQIMHKAPNSYTMSKTALLEFMEASHHLLDWTRRGHDMLCHATMYSTLTKDFLDPKQKLSNKSLIEDLQLVAGYEGYGVVVHPGQMKTTEQAANAAASCEDIFEKFHDQLSPYLLLENSVHGMHSTLQVLDKICKVANSNGANTGICLDTAHIYAAGIDLSESYMVKVHVVPFAESIKAVHFNNSRNPLGSNRDGHGKLADGDMPMEAVERMYRMLRDVLGPNVPFVVESTDDPNEISQMKAWSRGNVPAGQATAG
jgi:endonuclease IV